MSEEGLDHLHKIAGLAFLRYASGSRSNYRRLYGVIEAASHYFENLMREMLNEPWLASYEEMLQARIMKRKYITYSAYMATLSSYPLLARVAGLREIVSTILAKMTLITGIKTLDNLNDSLHSREEAVKSLERQFEAMTKGVFTPLGDDSLKARAENSALLLSSLIHRWLSSRVPGAHRMRRVFLDDLRRYIEGQKLSFNQQSREHRKSLNIFTYLGNVNEKGIGRIWVGLDLCMLEQKVQGLDDSIIQGLRESFDYLFKSCNIYDDVADLDVDMAAGIWNSVVYLGIDRGKLRVDGGFSLERSLLRDTVRLGDLHYLRAVDAARRVGCILGFDVSGLLKCYMVLRYFVMRKWFFRAKNPLDMIDFLNVRVPPHIQKYAIQI